MVSSKKKAVICSVILASLMALALTACSHTFKCGLCGEEKTEAGHKTNILGQEVEICDDCYNGLNA